MIRFASSTILSVGFFRSERLSYEKEIRYLVWRDRGRAENGATLQVCAALKTND
jgi:hypothetical protein